MSKARHFIVLLLFAACAALVGFSNIERKVQSVPVDLSAIPKELGDWRMVSEDSSLGKKESTFLDDVLIRTYQRKDGKQVMLAVAFGADQRKKFSIHLPEVCYASAGFSVTTIGQTIMESPHLKLKQLLVKDSAMQREIVQYWIVLNGKVVTNHFENRLRHFYITLFGAESGGLLVRISSVSNPDHDPNAYSEQHEFIAALYKGVTAEYRKLLFGDAAAQ